MPLPSRIIKSVLIASLFPPAIFTALSLIFGPPVDKWLLVTIFLAWFGGILLLVVVGLPVFLILEKLKQLHLRSISTAGFAIGFVAVTVTNWPLLALYDGYSSGGSFFGSYVELFINGKPTIYGWLNLLTISFLYGLLGSACSILFWRVWVSDAPNK